MSEKENNNRGSPLRKWAALSGIGLQMGATIFVCAWGGKKLDRYFGMEKSWFTIGLVLFGVFASLFVLMRQLKHLNKDDN